MTDTHKKTTFYKRWNVSYTQKNGWDPKDMTISATFEEGKEPDTDTMVELAKHAMKEALDACVALNALEAQDSTISRLKEAGTQ